MRWPTVSVIKRAASTLTRAEISLLLPRLISQMVGRFGAPVKPFPTWKARAMVWLSNVLPGWHWLWDLGVPSSIVDWLCDNTFQCEACGKFFDMVDLDIASSDYIEICHGCAEARNTDQGAR